MKSPPVFSVRTAAGQVYETHSLGTAWQPRGAGHTPLVLIFPIEGGLPVVLPANEVTIEVLTMGSQRCPECGHEKQVQKHTFQAEIQAMMKEQSLLRESPPAQSWTDPSRPYGAYGPCLNPSHGSARHDPLLEQGDGNSVVEAAGQVIPFQELPAHPYITVPDDGLASEELPAEAAARIASTYEQAHAQARAMDRDTVPGETGGGQTPYA